MLNDRRCAPALLSALSLLCVAALIAGCGKTHADKSGSAKRDARVMSSPRPAGNAQVAAKSAAAGNEKTPQPQRTPNAGDREGERSVDTTTTSTKRDVKSRVDEILTRLDRLPGETPSDMFFRYWGDNAFVETKNDALSTFSADVDTASYTLARNYLYKQGVLPPPEAVRTEEFVNFFEQGYEPPAQGSGVFAIHCEVAPSPFAHQPEYKLLRVGIKAREVSREQRKACSLIFIIDTSGSMREGGRLELVKDALKLLVKELDEGDTIGIVAFDDSARDVLEPVSGAEQERITSHIDSLFPDNSTNLHAGMKLGYRMAGRSFRKTASNRVILLSDGVANTGSTDRETILRSVREERQRGIYLTTIGVGMGNHNDALLEQLADGGNGQCVYVDRLEEARKVFVENLTGTLQTIAKDVKIQVEFDPGRVLRYRQLGYENRAVADEDFRDNRVDAGEVGAGHEVTALYEIKLAKPVEASGDGPAAAVTVDAPFATVRVRYLTVDHGEAVELQKTVGRDELKGSFAGASPRFQLGALAAEYAEVLRDSFWARGSKLGEVADRVEALLDAAKIESDDDAVELVALMRRADKLVQARREAKDEMTILVDAIQENNWMRAQIKSSRQLRRPDTASYLERLRTESAELRRRLEDLMDD